MMPMPPTSSDTAAMPASSAGERRGRLAQHVEQVGLVADAEVVWADSARRRCERRRAVWISPIAAGSESSALDARPDVVDAIGAEDAEAARVERNENLLVSVAESGRALASHDADHGELASRRCESVSPMKASRIGDVEQRQDVGAEHGDARTPMFSAAVNIAPIADREPAHVEEVRRVPVTCTLVFLVPPHDLQRSDPAAA